jgi:hypothetical protein
VKNVNTSNLRDKLLRNTKALIDLASADKLSNREFLKQQLGLVIEDLETLLRSIEYGGD